MRKRPALREARTPRANASYGPIRLSLLRLARTWHWLALAYALLAGLPAHVGLYAGILPLAIYAVFGTSRTLSVGPVAVASLMTAAALAPLADTLEQAFIYGSVAKGDAHAGSDVDVMLIGDDLSYSEVMELLAPAEQQLQRTINPTLYSPAEFEQRIKDNQSFVTRVLDHPRLDHRFSHYHRTPCMAALDHLVKIRRLKAVTH
mgnify:CR=1 FL=1